MTADTVEVSSGRIHCPALSIWGASSKFGQRFEPIAYWRTQAQVVEGIQVPGGHFIAQESPKEVGDALLNWFSG